MDRFRSSFQKYRPNEETYSFLWLFLQKLCTNLKFMMMKKTILMFAFAGASLSLQAQLPSVEGFRDGIHHWNLLHKNRAYVRYEESDYEKIADNLIAYQNEDGGWMKNIDWLAVLPADSVKAALTDRYRMSTLDNRNTFPQIEYLADVYVQTQKDKYKEAALKGLLYVLDTQKPNGGWRGWDVDAITFNDEVTTGALELLQRITFHDGSFAWLGAEEFCRIENAYRRGIDMILKCQVVQQGVKTVWGQQHDNVTLEPVGARTFELPGLTACESCPIIGLLMNIPDPSPEICEAVECAVAWLKKVAIHGIRVERVPLEESRQYNHEYPYDNVVVEDPDARLIWARFYETEDNTPFMCRRDGRKVWKLADVNGERRTGYDWYGYWPEAVLNRYPQWLQSCGKKR